MIRRRGGADRIYIFEHPVRAYIGKTLAEAAALNGTTPRNMVYLLQVQGYPDRFGGGTLRGFSMIEEDVDVFAAQPWVATASDAGIALPEDGSVHPRYYGTFPRKLARFARDREVLDFGQAVRSMTSLPAEILGLEDRGILREGAVADIAVLDVDALADKASYFRPHRFPEGVPYVFVNGVAVIDEGEATYALPGRVLRRENTPAHTDD
jgi:N-acyl-D-amino-acid deacylase